MVDDAMDVSVLCIHHGSFDPSDVMECCFYDYCTFQDIDLPGLATLTPKDYQSFVLLKVNLNVLEKWVQQTLIISIYLVFY